MMISLLPAALACALMQPPSFDYDKTKPVDVKDAAPGVTVRQIT